MKKRQKDKFLNKAVTIRDSLAERIELLASGESTFEEIKQIKELTSIVRELDKMVRENRDEDLDRESSCSNFLSSLLEQ